MDAQNIEIKRESGIFWNDPELKIKWPVKKPILSAKDKNNKPFGFFFDLNEKS